MPPMPTAVGTAANVSRGRSATGQFATLLVGHTFEDHFADGRIVVVHHVPIGRRTVDFENTCFTTPRRTIVPRTVPIIPSSVKRIVPPDRFAHLVAHVTAGQGAQRTG